MKTPSRLPLFLTIILLVLAPAFAAFAAETSISILNHQAVGDGKTLNTKAIQAAIDACPAGGVVTLPKGVFVSGALFLKPGVNLHLHEGSVLKGSPEIRDYPKMKTRIEGQLIDWIPALVNADKCDLLRITGPGTLDGNGQVFWSAFWDARKADPKVTNLAVERPRLVLIQNSNEVQVSGVKFKDSGFWNLHLYRSTDVVVENASFEAPGGKAPRRAPSSDGIDIDSCQRVTVRGCTFSVNDDCIALKGTKGPFALKDKDSPPVEQIRISDCTFRAGHAAVTCGSEATIVRDVVVENCRVAGNMPLVNLKLRPDTAQLYEDIHFRNITLAGGGDIISIKPWTQFFDLKGQPKPRSIVRNLTLTDIKGSFGSLGTIKGNPGQTEIRDLTHKNIDVQLKDSKFDAAGLKNLEMKNVTVNGKPFSPKAGK